MLGLLASAGVGAIGRVEAQVPPPPTLAELVEASDLSGLSASPDGRLVAFRADQASLNRNGYDLAWHVLDLATGSVRVVAGGGEPIVEDPGHLAAEAPVWSPDSGWIYFRALHDGDVQIWRAAAGGSAAERVTSEDGDVLSLEAAPDGHGISYRIGPAREAIERAEIDEYRDGILVDAHVELGQNVFRGAIINGRHATERLTGQWFLRGGVLWSQPSRRRQLDFASLESSAAVAEKASPPPALGTMPPATEVRSSRGDTASAVWNGRSSTLTVTRRGEARAVTCSVAACRDDQIRWTAWRPGADQLVFATADRGRVETLHVWDLGRDRVRTLATGPGLLSGGRDSEAPCAIGRTVAACVEAGPTTPPRLTLIDLETGARRTAFDPNPLLRERHWPRYERLTWQGAGERSFTGLMFLPPGGLSAPAPLFINYYQCDGFIRGGVGDEWPFVALAETGFVSVCINATRLDDAEDGVGRYRAALDGIRELIDRLVELRLVDRSRVGMGGLSFGSEVTMWTVIHSDLIAAASIASPQFEPANYWFNGVRGRDHHDVMRRFWGLGAPEETPEQWRLLSPALNVDRIRAPLLLQLPEQEARYAVELYARLTNSATPTEMYVFPDERHIKMQPLHRLAAYRRNVDWFSFWLQGHVEPDPARADQFRRWQALRERARAGPQPARDRSQSSSEARSNNRK